MSPSSEPLYQPLLDDATLAEEVPESLDVDTGTRWTFFMLGCSLLLTWNALITALPFFLSRFEGSPRLKLSFASYLTTTCNVVSLVSLAYATFFRRKSSSPSLVTRRMILALTALTFMLVLSTKIRLPASIFAFFVLLNAAVQAACCSHLQHAVIGVGSLFGPVALQSIVSGQAAVGVAVSAIQVISAAMATWGMSRDAIATYVNDGSAEERAAFVFFTFSTVFFLFCALAHSWLVKTPLYHRIAAPLEDTVQHRDPIVEGEKKSRILRLAKDNVAYEFAIAYVFFITLMAFPPITTSILPISSDIHPLLFNAIHFFVFNFGDLFGRYLVSYPRFLIWSAQRLVMLSIFRTIFIPLFLACNMQQAAITNNPPLIHSDFLYMFILLMFGVSNGYLTSMCMISAPSPEHNPRLRGRKEDVDAVATITNFSLVGGLFIGSAASFGVKAVICKCNPFTG